MEFNDFAIDLAKQAGKLMRDNFKLGMAREWKDDGTILTETDKAINKLVIESIKATFPDHGIIAEEGSEYNNEEFTWVCDPVDGTGAFNQAVPFFVFSLALTKDGEPILGVIYDPILDRLFFAEKGKGSTLNGKPIHVNDNKDIHKSTIGSTYWRRAKYDLSQTEYYFDQDDILFYEYMSIAYYCALVAAGQVEAAIFPGEKPWDVAAGKIIIEEAGGKTTDLFNDTQPYNAETKGFIGSNGLIHDELTAIIKKTMR